MTVREIIALVCGRVRVNFNDPEADVSYSMCGEASEIRCAGMADSFLDCTIYAVSPNDYEIVISCNPPAGDDK